MQVCIQIWKVDKNRFKYRIMSNIKLFENNLIRSVWNEAGMAAKLRLMNLQATGGQIVPQLLVNKEWFYYI